MYDELKMRFNGFNNGSITFSHREAAERLQVNRRTAKKGFDELEEKGFTKARVRGAFTVKKRH